jgi:hypothetical protein
MTLPLEIMTSDPDKPETFRSHLPAIVAATVGTVLATILGSLMGTAGTIAGMTLGSLASGTFSWWTERGIRRSTAIAIARAAAIRARGRPLSPEEDAAVTQVLAAADQDRARPLRRWAGPRRRWAGPAALAAVAFMACAVTVTLLEQAAGKPLSAVVEGKPGHGTTLGGGGTGGADPASPTPTPSASTTGPAATAPASPTPGRGSSSPAASPTPAATVPGGTGSAGNTTPSAIPTARHTSPAPGAVSSSAGG